MASDLGGGETSDWRPTASWENLQKRAGLLKAVRKFFDRRGFLEVQTPLLSADTIVDRHIEPITVPWDRCGEARQMTMGVSAGSRNLYSDGSNHPCWYLQTSPEFCMKRLLAFGGQAIYQIAPAFRAGERGTLHNPEFTLVEWYRVGHDLEEGMNLLDEFCREILGTLPAEKCTYRELFEEHMGLNPHQSSCQIFAATADRLGLAPPTGLEPDDPDSWRDWLFVELIQPKLGKKRPTIVYDYPATQCGLAKLRDGTPPVAERFELFIEGLELANGYHELGDPDEMQRRFRTNNQWRAREGKLLLPESSRLLSALWEVGLPSCTGCALGFDRLVMIAVRASRIDEVIAFPIERA